MGKLAIIHYLDPVAFEMTQNPDTMVPAPCRVVGAIQEKTDDFIRIIYREEGPLGDEATPRTYGMVIPMSIVTKLVEVPDE